jgi:hypothetical protein
MGGSNAKENLVEVSITQHAIFHYCNYQLWKNEEDRLAWLGLSKLIEKADLMTELYKIAVEKARSPEIIEKKKKIFKEKTIKKRKRIKFKK